MSREPQPWGSAVLARKVVSIVRCDITGSTALGERFDAETLQDVMARYFREMRAVIERHGGTVEKFIGDAVMAVFGIPVLHEDDALRAVRAAADMRDALATLNSELARDSGFELQVRTSVTTGEVVAGDPSGGQAFVTGDAANVAARLETSAQPGEILLGEPTHRLVSAAVEAEPVEPLTVKGKAEPLAAWRLLRVRPGAELFRRRLDTPMVGRRPELAMLMHVYERAKAERRFRVVTVLGEPGIGKSRLSDELAREIGDDATVLRGRCLPYGEGITYWPLRELLESAARVGDHAEIGAALEAVDGGASADVTFLAVRSALERLAGDRPLALMLDDLQWAEPTFLDLLERIARFARDASILLVAIARPEFADRRPEWPGTTIRLEPLTGADAGALVDRLAHERAVTGDARARVAAAAAGNPLFIEQMVAMLEGEAADVPVPPTIQALLAARVDQLDVDRRRALECASVVGQQFWSGAVQELAGDGAAVGPALADLVRLDFVAPDEPTTFAEEEAFRFVHILVRDAAYEAIPKRRRSELHERFAAWIDRKGEQDALEHEEIAGYHLEQATRYLEALGPPNEHSRRLAQDAARRLMSAGRKALNRDDMPAAANLLRRGVDLLPWDDSARLRALSDLAEALVGMGRLAEAVQLLEHALADARAAGDPGAAAHAQVEQQEVLLLTDPEGASERILPVAAEAIRIFDELGDDLGLARAWHLRSQVAWLKSQTEESTRSLERALLHAERAGSRRAVEIRRRLMVTLSRGARPIDEVLPRCREMLSRSRGDPVAEAACLGEVAFLEAQRGNFETAADLMAKRSAIIAEIGLPLTVAISKAVSAKVAMLAGDLATAEREWREGCELFTELGERGFLSTRAAELAEKALYAQGKYDEAERFALLGREVGASDDVETQVRWRGAMAKVLARRGDHEAAARLVGEALEVVPADGPELRGDALMDAAETFRLAGRNEDAAAAARQAQATYEAKGMVVRAESARAYG